MSSGDKNYLRANSLCANCINPRLCEWLLTKPKKELLPYWEHCKGMKVDKVIVSNKAIKAGWNEVYYVTECPLYMEEKRMTIIHKSNRTDQLNTIIYNFGVKGYGIYWLLAEAIGEANNKYPLKPYWENELALQIEVAPEEVKRIMELGVNLDLFKTDGKILSATNIKGTTKPRATKKTTSIKRGRK